MHLIYLKWCSLNLYCLHGIVPFALNPLTAISFSLKKKKVFFAFYCFVSLKTIVFISLIKVHNPKCLYHPMSSIGKQMLVTMMHNFASLEIPRNSLVAQWLKKERKKERNQHAKIPWGRA